MSRARLRHLIRHRWERYLWLTLRSAARKLARERQDTHHVSPTYRRGIMREIDQCWAFLMEAE